MSIIDRILRRLFFPQRDHKHTMESDTVCQREVDTLIPSDVRAAYALELDTRLWLRNFKSKSIVAWLALFLSVISITIAICSFVVATTEHQGKSADTALEPKTNSK